MAIFVVPVVGRDDGHHLDVLAIEELAVVLVHVGLAAPAFFGHRPGDSNRRRTRRRRRRGSSASSMFQLPCPPRPMQPINRAVAGRGGCRGLRRREEVRGPVPRLSLAAAGRRRRRTASETSVRRNLTRRDTLVLAHKGCWLRENPEELIRKRKAFLYCDAPGGRCKFCERVAWVSRTSNGQPKLAGLRLAAVVA